MKLIRTEDAVGHVLCHDMTQIIPGVIKDARFRKGHIVTEEDIPVLLSIGKEHLYVWEKTEGMLHEDEGAERLRRITQNENMHPSVVKEGKIELFADVDGLFQVDVERLYDVNSVDEIMIATRHTNTAVKKGDKLAGMRVIPLIIDEKRLEEAEKKAKLMLEQVGINEKCYNKSPFELSGGQKRRVAIAGVLAMNPEIIVLDEPTAGLDPKGRDKILNRIKELHDNTGIGVVLVSHSMEDVANYAQRLIVINNGKIKYDGMPKDVFKHYKELEKMGLKAPQITYIMHKLKEKGLDVDENVITIEEARENIMQCLNRKDI